MSIPDRPLPPWHGDPDDHDLGIFVWENLLKKKVFLPTWALTAGAALAAGEYYNLFDDWKTGLAVGVMALLGLPAFTFFGSYTYSYHLDDKHYDHDEEHIHFLEVLTKGGYNLLAMGVNSVVDRTAKIWNRRRGIRKK